MRLIGTDGTKLYSWELKPGKYLLGRTATCHFFVPDRTISKRHAEIALGDGVDYCLLTDLESKNGTLVNGEKISSPVQVKTGDRIMFGDAEFRLAEDADGSTRASAQGITRPAEKEPEKSVFLSINEALKPLPSKITDIPELFPTLSELARILVLDQPREAMLEHTLSLVAKVIPAERLAVLFTSDDHTEIYPAATLLPGGKDPGHFTLSRTIIGEILTNKNAILIGDAAVDPRFAAQQSIILSELKSAMAVPLFDEGEVLGILYVDTTNPLHHYCDDYLRLLATFGNIIASRIANYQLLSDREEKRVTDAELRRASAIQKSMLTGEVPTLEGYSVRAFLEPSLSVGGDLYDVCVLPDGRLLFMVADVSGKGTGAALLMSNLLASFRILYTSSDFDLLRVVQQVSGQLHKYTPPEMFATLMIGVADPVSHQISFVNAGHNPPIIRRTDSSIELLEATGFMIGAFPSGDWENKSIKMNPGDLLTIFSDGVTEAENEKDMQYSDERLEQFLSGIENTTPEEASRLLVADIMKFTEGAPQSDDITILMIRRDS